MITTKLKSKNNFFLIDKPLNWTSFDVVKKMKSILNEKKIGHTGTLDPLATGCLLVATGKYTKLISFLSKDNKEYEFEVCLDGTTKSYDLGEEITFLSEEKQKYFKENLKKEDLEIILQKHFSGKIKQIPPKYSALKIDGQKAYNLARNGEDFILKEREIEIFEIKLLDFCYPKARILAKVSAGTYIRSIANDLGKILGCGGYVTFLNRIKIGYLSLNNASKLENPAELNIKNLFDENKFVSFNEKILEELKFGRFVKNDFGLKEDEEYFVIQNENIVSVIICKDALLKPILNIF